MSLKTERIIYTAKNFTTGLTDITAAIRRNGVSVAAAVALTEIAGGRYELVLSPATLTGYGGAGFYDFFIDSASKPAPAVATKWILLNNEDDLETHIAAIEGKIDIIDTNLDSVKVTVEDTNTKVNSGTFGLSALKALIDSVQSTVSNISNTTRQNIAMPVEMITDTVAATLYRVPIRLYNNAGGLEDPDTNAIQVSAQDEVGNDRTSYITGFVSGPVNATRTAQGVYYVDISIPANSPKEQLNFFFDYQENALPLSAVRTTNVTESSSASGLALQSTLLDVLADTAAMQPQVADIQTKINDATYGLAALKSLIDVVDGNVDLIKLDTTGILAELANGTYGLAAIKTSVTTVNTNVDSVKGVGFNSAEDTLHQISTRVYQGGIAH